MRKLIIANWKMNINLDDSDKFCAELTGQNYNNRLIIATPAPYLAYLANKFQFIEFCAQNVSQFTEQGNYTGEYSSLLLKLSNINNAIVGHSERRQFLEESNKLVRQKAENCLKVKITPIICIGENLKIRKKNEYKNFLLTQLTESLPRTQSNNQTDLAIIIAYEPIWAVGTGVIPSEEQLIEIFDLINVLVAQSYVANNVSLVYGGSVNENNIQKILSLPNIDGVMLGKSSLDCQILVQMLNYRFF
jgi:triosephosphate isomerase